MLPWRHRLIVKLAAIGLIFVLILGLSLYWQYHTIRSHLIASGQSEAASLARSIKSSVITFILETEAGGALIESLVDSINKGQVGARLRVVRSAVVNSQYGVIERARPQSPEEKKSLADGEERSYETLDAFAHVAPLHSLSACSRCHQKKDGSNITPGTIMGLVVVEVEKGPLDMRLGKLRTDTVQSMGVVILLLAAIAGFISYVIVRPIAGTLRSMRKVTGGDMTARAENYGDSEIGLLAKNFNTMAERLERSFEKLYSFNEELQAEVAAQTTRLTQARNYYRSIIDSSQRLIITTDRNLLIDSVNAEWNVMVEKRGVRLKRKDLISEPILSFAPASKKEEYSAILHMALDNVEQRIGPQHSEEILVYLEGHTSYFSVSVSPLFDDNKNVVGLVLVGADVTELRRVTDLLKIEHDKLNAIMNGMGDWVMIVADNYEITYMNKLMQDSFGGEAALGEKCFRMVAERESPCPGCTVERRLHGRFSVEVQGPAKRYYLSTQTPVADFGGRRSTIGVYKDITFQKKMEEELREETLTDPLTGLQNKRAFPLKIAEEMRRTERQKGEMALLFADIDKFKSYNDTYGHEAGDDLLRTLGLLITTSLRLNVDIGFRYGGEEFVVILPDAGEKIARRVGERIRKSFAETPFYPLLDGKKVEVHKTISIGLAILAATDDPTALVERADSAMYAAKKAGGDRIEKG